MRNAAPLVVVGGGVTGLCTALMLARKGQEVVLLEAERVGALASGRNTGKVTLLQGTKLSTLLNHHPRVVAMAYVEANREGLDWLGRFCQDHFVAHERREALTFAATADEVRTVRAELRAAQELGVPMTWYDDLDVPFEMHGAVALADQLQLDPVELIAALAAEFERHGGRIAESSRVVDVSFGLAPVAQTADNGEQLLHLASVQERPHVLLEFTRDRPFLFDRPRTQCGAGDRQPFVQHRPQVDLRARRHRRPVRAAGPVRVSHLN